MGGVRGSACRIASARDRGHGPLRRQLGPTARGLRVLRRLRGAVAARTHLVARDRGAVLRRVAAAAPRRHDGRPSIRVAGAGGRRGDRGGRCGRLGDVELVAGGRRRIAEPPLLRHRHPCRRTRRRMRRRMRARPRTGHRRTDRRTGRDGARRRRHADARGDDGDGRRPGAVAVPVGIPAGRCRVADDRGRGHGTGPDRTGAVGSPPRPGRAGVVRRLSLALAGDRGARPGSDRMVGPGAGRPLGRDDRSAHDDLVVVDRTSGPAARDGGPPAGRGLRRGGGARRRRRRARRRGDD